MNEALFEAARQIILQASSPERAFEHTEELAEEFGVDKEEAKQVMMEIYDNP